MVKVTGKKEETTHIRVSKRDKIKAEKFFAGKGIKNHAMMFRLLLKMKGIR